MADPYMTKERVRETMQTIDSLNHFLKTFLDSENGEDFYGKVKYARSDGKDFSELEKLEMVDNMVRHNVIGLDIFNNELIPYLKSQPKSYQSFVNTVLFPTVLPALKSTLETEGLENKIYQYEDSDSIHDVYLVLKGAYMLFTRLDDLLSGVENDTDYALDYQLSFLGSYLDEEDEEAIPMPLPNAFTWFGTPAELACFMETLYEKGYIDAPKRTSGERNNEAFNRMINAHFRLAEGSDKSVLNNLKDSRITPDNQFKIAMDKLPKKR